MAWISSKHFYRRLMQSQMHITEQFEQQASATSETMQKELDAIIDERDELRRWKEAHLNLQKDSATGQYSEDCEKSQEESRVLKSDLAASRTEGRRVQIENEELRLSLRQLENESREAKCLQKSFDELRIAHEQLKKSNDMLERHLAVITRDLEFQAQACRELERSRADLQDEVDSGRIELQARKKTISHLAQVRSSKDDEMATMSSKLELAWDDLCQSVQSRKELESQLEEGLLRYAALWTRAIDYERDLEKLQVEHELVCNQFQDLADNVSASKQLTTEIFSKDWDSFNDEFLKAMLIVLMALGFYGVYSGNLA